MAATVISSASGSNSHAPMIELNTTPLIDIMLVLLIMFIITIPPQSHQVAMDQATGQPPVHVDALKNELTLDAAGKARWNGEAVDDRQVQALLRTAATMESQPEVHFRPDAAARYERVDQLLAMAAQAGNDRFGFVGNEGYRDIF